MIKMVKNDQNSQEWPKIVKMIKKVNNYKKMVMNNQK